MSQLHVKYLLAGGGLASSAAAKAIRQLDPEGSILLLGQEITRPYHRPPLSKAYLRAEKPREQLFTLEPGWFVQNRVELRTGRRLTQVDAARRAVLVDDGEQISFDRLLIATGATPRHLDLPGADLPNVYYLRTLEDADRLRNAIEKARREGRTHPAGRGRVAVIGGGVLGVELAASLTQMGLQAHLFSPKPWPWDKFAGEDVGRLLARYLESHGVQLHLATPLQRLEGDGRVQRIVPLQGDGIDCDFVVAAVGRTINKDFLRGTSIIAEKAIMVDDHCRTNVPEIYAAGDCAALLDPLFGKHRILDHWDNANVTGALAGRNMAGADEAYDAVNYFFSDVFDLSLSVWGEARFARRRLLRGALSIQEPKLVEFGIADDGRLAQVLAIGHSDDEQTLREMVHRRLRVDGNEEAMKAPDVPLQTLL